MELLISRRTPLPPTPSFSVLETKLADGLRAVLRREGASEDAEISLVLCDDDFIRGLNAQYRGLDRPTDVLSFGQEPLPGFADPPRNGEGRAGHEAESLSYDAGSGAPHDSLLPFREEPCGAREVGVLPWVLGDIVISLPTAARQAERAGWPLESELVLLAVHGCLHLLGHDDETAAGAALMQHEASALLAEVGIPPPVEGSHPFFVEYP